MARSREEWYEVLDTLDAGFAAPGGKRALWESSHETLTYLGEIGAWKPGDRVLDIGCGKGRLAIALSDHPGSYTGLESMLPCVTFARRAFAAWPDFHFHHLDVRNATYNP